MSEGRKLNIHELPRNDEARNKVAQQVIEARRIDRASRKKLTIDQRRIRNTEYLSGMIGRPEKDWTNNRRGREYVRCLQGLEASLSYIKELRSNLVLDIGTGTSEGIADIANSDLGQGLQFKGTSVTPQPDFKNYLGKDRVIITPAESLRGVENNSVGGALALHSLTYSAEPQYVVTRLDQVLVDGGLVKLLAYHDEVNQGRLGEKTIKPFLNVFKDFGYDVAISDNILLAIKPSSSNSNSAASANDLIDQDRLSMQKWEYVLDRQKD